MPASGLGGNKSSEQNAHLKTVRSCPPAGSVETVCGHGPLCAYRLPRGAAVAGRAAGRMLAGIDGEVRPMDGATPVARGAACG